VFLLLSLTLNGWLWYHLKALDKVVTENRAAIQYIFIYLNELELEVEKTFNVK
jgi:hypothetical protein